MNEYFSVLAGHYNKCITTPLSEEQISALCKYLESGDICDAESLPRIDKKSSDKKPVDHITRDEKKKKELPVLCRYLYLVYNKGGEEIFNHLIKRGLWFDHYGYRLDSFWNPGTPLTPIQKIDYILYAMDEDLEENIGKAKKIRTAHPVEFDEICNQGTPQARRRAAAFLYMEDPEKYGPVLDKLIEIYDAEPDREGVEALYNTCATCQFKHQKTNEKYAEYFRKNPGAVVNQMEYDKEAYKGFLDDKFRKNYDTVHSTAAQLNYSTNMAKFLGVEDQYLLKGIYEECNHYHMKDVITHFKQYPVELILGVYKEIMSKRLSAYLVSQAFVHFYSILEAMDADKTPLFTIAEKKFDTFTEEYIKYAFDLEDEDSDYADIADEVKAYFNGDRALLKKFSSREHLEKMYGLSGATEIFEFLGLMAGYTSVADKVRPIAQLAAFTGQVYNMARFLQGAIREYNWDGETLNNYFMEAYTNGFVGEWGMLVFYDEVLLSDMERRPKENQILTQAISDMFVPYARNFIKAHEDTVVEFYKTGSNFGFIRAHYTENPDANPQPLVDFLEMKNKELRAKALKYLPSYPSARPAVEALLNSKRKDIREFAEKALAGFENINAISLDGSKTSAPAAGNFDIAAYVKKSMPKNWQKTLEFTDPKNWQPIRKPDSEELVEQDYVICYVATYAANKDMQKMLYPEKMRPYFNEADMKTLSLQLFDEWNEAGADNKTKGIMTILGIHGDVEGIQKLKDIISHFILWSRSAIAGDAVKAMAVSNSRIALVTVDNMARTHRNKLVKRIAGETMTAAAESLGMTVEELSDKIVPNLGFDERGELTLDTGVRKFTVKLKANLTVELINQEGKILKSFPASNAQEDLTYTYAEAKSDFATLKKELKSLVAMQALRLQQSLAKGKKWTKESFEELFIQNPIMQVFATALIFGVYKEGKPEITFRYSGDGSYADINDNTFTLDNDAEIRLVHPVEMKPEDIKQWKQQLDDYELTQPFPQLNRPVFDAASVTSRTYDAFSGVYVNDYFGKRMHRMGWDRDPSGDAGSYYCIYYIGSEYAACADFNSGSICIGYDDIDNVEVGPVYFAKTENVTVNYRNSIHDGDIIPPAEIPAPFFSEVIYMMTQGVESSKLKDQED